MDAISEALAGRKWPVKYWFRYWISDRNGTRTTEITEHVNTASISCDNDRDSVRVLSLEMKANSDIELFDDHIMPVMYLRTFQILPPGTLTEVIEEFQLGIFATDFARKRITSTGDTWSMTCNDMSIHLIEATVIAESTNERQRVAIPDRITGGTYTLTFNGQTTANITHPASAAAVTSALEALSNVAPGDVVITGETGGPYVVNFAAAYAARNVPQMTGNPANLTPANKNPAVIITTLQQGGAGAGYTVASGVEYSIGAVADILIQQGFSPLRLALPSDDTLTPQDFTAAPGTSWLKIINDFLDGINCHHLWFDNYGFSTSRTREIMSEMQGDVLYESDQNSIILGDIVIEDNQEEFFNQVICVSGDPSYPQAAVTVTNINPASPYSTVNIGRTITEGPIEFPKIADLPTLTSRCQAELEKVSANNGRTVKFGTVIDPRRKPHEFYKLNLYAGRNEVQKLEISGAPTGGTFTLTLDDQETAPLSYRATNAQIEFALEQLINIGTGNVKVYGGPLPDYAVLIEFVGQRSASNQMLLEPDDSFTGGSSPETTVTEVVAGLSRGERVEGIYRVLNWNMPLKVGGTMTHEVGKVDEVL